PRHTLGLSQYSRFSPCLRRQPTGSTIASCSSSRASNLPPFHRMKLRTRPIAMSGLITTLLRLPSRLPRLHNRPSPAVGEQTFEGRRENLAQANKLSRTYATLLEALNRHRGKGQQRVTVEHVHVHSGGQAVAEIVSSSLAVWAREQPGRTANVQYEATC